VHEFAICEALISMLQAELKKCEPAAAKLQSARLVAGELRQIVPPAISFAFEVLTKNTPLEGAVLEVVVAPITARCRKCNWHGEIEHMRFQCPECGSAALDIEGGRELYLEGLVIEQNEQPGNQGI